MELYLFAVAAAVVIVCVVAVQRGTQRAGPGEKRTLAAIALGYVWAVITMTIFVPAGAVFALLMMRESPLSAIGILAIVASGIAHAVTLVRAGRRLRSAAPEANVTVRNVALYGFAHHVGVFVGFGVPIFVHDHGLEAMQLVGVLAVPCVLGLAIAGVLHGATTLAPAPAPA